MRKEFYSMADRIRTLREGLGMTQAELARALGITRSGVNGWEMGLAVPSTPYVVELAGIFGVSTDYLLGVEGGAALSVAGLTDRQVRALLETIRCFQAVAD